MRSTTSTTLFRTKATKSAIPKLIHYVRMGTQLLSDAHFYDMLVSSSMHRKAGYEMILWVEPAYFTNPDLPTFTKLRQLEKHGFKIKNFLELADDPMRKELCRLALHELSIKGIPVCAADILRIAALHKHGGYYFDSDISFAAPLPKEEITLPEDFGYGATAGDIDEYVNSSIATVAGSTMITLIGNTIQTNYKTLADDRDLSDIDTLQAYVIDKTGPGALKQAVEHYLQQKNYNVGTLRLCRFSSKTGHQPLGGLCKEHEDASWLPDDGHSTNKTELTERETKCRTLLRDYEMRRKTDETAVPKPVVTTDECDPWLTPDGCSIM